MATQNGVNWGKIILWTAIVGGATAGIYFIVKAIKKAKDENGGSDSLTPDPSASTGGAANDTPCMILFPLQKGSGAKRGQCEIEPVKVVQQYLNTLIPNNPMDVDGDWWNTTDKYIKTLLSLTSLTEAQYNLIKQGKSPIQKPVAPPYTFTFVVAGTPYTVTVSDDKITPNQKIGLVNAIIAMPICTIENTTSNKNKLLQRKATELATWYYYGNAGYQTYVYEGNARYTKNGKIVEI